ncbi:putative peptidase S8 [Oleoguttula sp. CCFEE 5521]
MNYDYLEDSGKGVDVYILDSGINKIDAIKDLVVDELDVMNVGFADGRNHGTIVAQFVASAKYGSAKKPTLRNCQVMRGDIPDKQAVIDTLREIIKRNDDRKTKPGYKGAIINMSFETQGSTELENIIDLAISKKITVVAAAGNEGIEARNLFPCTYEDVICVGAMDKTYSKATFQTHSSNYGRALTLYAPGVALSGFDSTGTERTDLEGTSFATPYVAGLAAIFYGVEGPTTPARIKNLLTWNGENNTISGTDGTGKIVANSGYMRETDKPYWGAPAPLPPVAPLVSLIGQLASSLAATPTTLATSTVSPPPPPPATTTTEPPPTESCHTQYKLVLDTFDIWGSNWDDAKFGVDGAGLHDQLSGCAEVTKWKFDPQTPTDNSPWEFHVSGQITIWQQTCIEHAMVSAGAPDGSQCSGTG